MSAQIALDAETRLIRPGYMAPEMACATWSTVALEHGIWHARDAEPHLRKLLEDDSVLLGLNMAYDMGVVGENYPHLLEAVFEKYLGGLIRDVGLDQRLIDIAHGELDGRHEANPNFDPSQPVGKKNKTTRYRRYKYSLAFLSERLLGEIVAKGEDTWRMRYGSLIDVPMSQWPADAKHYAEKDAVLTMRVHLAQRATAERWYETRGGPKPEWNDNQNGGLLVDSESQAQANFGLHLMSARGLRTDGPACLRLIEAAEVEIERCRALCEKVGLLVRTKKGKLQKKQAPARAWMIGALLRANGLPDDEHSRMHLEARIEAFLNGPKDHIEGINLVPFGDEVPGDTEIAVSLTKTGEICLDAEACKDVGDPVLRAYATYTSATTLRGKTKRMLFGATGPLQGRFQTLKYTGRTSMSKPQGNAQVGDNYQNMRRNAMETEDGDVLPGQRECFVARPGFIYGSIDLDNAEMRSMAQACIWKIGHSRLAESLNAGQDCHLALAASRLLKTPLPYEEAKCRAKEDEIANARQFAKVPNFALLGGARAKTMIPYAKGMNIILTEERANELYAGFHSQWTEIAPYHRMIRDELKRGGGSMLFEQFVSQRIRFVDRYTVGCNTGFQGLTADGAKSALLWIAVECYTGREHMLDAQGRPRATGKRSPLYGSYPVLFAHDEVVTEFWIPNAHDAAYRQRDIQVQAYNRYTPDVPMTAEPALSFRWYKNAKTVKDAQGKLIAWEPQLKAA